MITEENYCVSSYETIWLAVLFSYKGVLTVSFVLFILEKKLLNFF
jgi:hypothetical protein